MPTWAPSGSSTARFLGGSHAWEARETFGACLPESSEKDASLRHRWMTSAARVVTSVVCTGFQFEYRDSTRFTTPV